MRKMKDSGIEWIGEIPDEWKYTKLKYHFTFEKGKNAAIYTNEYIGVHLGKYPVYSGQTENNGIMGSIDTYDYDIDECLFTTTVGAKVMTPKVLHGKFSLSQNCLIMQKRDNICTKFAYYMLLCLFSYEKSLIPNYMQPSLRIDDLNTYSFYIPQHKEQLLISSYLDRKCALIDSVIEKTRASIEEYKKLRQAVITQAVTKGVRGDRPMKDSGIEWIGEIPQEWTIRKVRNIAKTINGDRSKNYPNAEELKDEGILFVTSNNLNGTELDVNITTNKFISEEKYNSMGGAKICMNDIIFCLRGSVGKCSINHCIKQGTIASSLVVVRAIEVIPEYLNYYLKSSFILEQATLNAIGIGSLNLAAEDIAATLVAVPPIYEQTEISAYLDRKCSEIDTIITKKETFLTELDKYKKSLIYECVTGKREVPSA